MLLLHLLLLLLLHRREQVEEKGQWVLREKKRRILKFAKEKNMIILKNYQGFDTLAVSIVSFSSPILLTSSDSSAAPENSQLIAMYLPF